MRSFSSVSVILACVFTITVLINNIECRSTLRCRPCIGSECEEEPTQFCAYGEYLDACDRRQCAKGPGELCGGPSRALGECGDGMMCSNDDRCIGCSIHTLKCNA